MSSLTHSSRVSSGRLATSVTCCLLAGLLIASAAPAARADANLFACGSNSFGQLGITSVRLPGAARIGNVTAIAAGHYHTLALRADGTVWGWGWNVYGQLGDGTTNTTRVLPVQAVGLNNVIAVAAGGSRSMALKADGTVWAWGSVNSSSSPVQVPGLSGVIAIAVGANHQMVLKSDGAVWAWGNNDRGELGDGTTTARMAPVQALGLSGATAIAASPYAHSLAIKADGTVWAWGDNSNGQLGTAGTDNTRPSQVLRIANAAALAASWDDSTAALTDGTVWRWGNSPQPVQITGLTQVTRLASGADYTLAVRSDGTVWGWGANEFGQLGDGTATTATNPVQVQGLTNITSVASSWDFTAALRSDGSVWTCGDNTHGQFGDGTTLSSFPALGSYVAAPDLVTSLSGTGSISAHASCSILLKPDGTVWTWGNNLSSPTQLTGLSDVSAVSAGGDHYLALKSDGTVWAWGNNGHGQLGRSGSSSSTPVRSGSLTGVVKIAAGTNFSLALKSDGTVWAWGCDIYYQLGDTTEFDPPDKTWPVQVLNLTNVVHIATSCGYGPSLAVKSDGTLWRWGENATQTPTQMAGFSNVVTAACGEAHYLAVKSDGTLWAFGYNEWGQLGDGTTTSSYSTPVPIARLSYVSKVAAGSMSSFAVDSEGRLWSWGANAGSGVTLPQTTPVQIAMTGATAVAAGSEHILVIATSAGSSVLGTWPASGSTEANIRNLVVSFGQSVQNVSADDLVLSAGTVTSVSGSGRGPYSFSVAGLPSGPVNAIIDGDITGLGGTSIPPYSWSFTAVQPVGPVITQQPASLVGCRGDTFQFTAAATGSPTYQWQKNGVNLTDGGHYLGVTTNTLTVAGADDTDRAAYRCIVTEGNAVTSVDAWLFFTVSTFASQPANRTVCPGDLVTFTVGSIAGCNTACRWQKDGVDLVDDGHFSGTNTPTLTIADTVYPTDAGQYRCVANEDGVASTAATLAFTWLVVPSLYNQYVCQGGTAAFYCAATGCDLTYQWQRGTLNLVDDGHYSGTTTSTLKIFDAQPSDAGSYKCVVTASTGWSSSSARLIVQVPVTITSQSGAQNRCLGATAYFSVSVNTTDSVTYQWQKNGVNLTNGGHYSYVTTSGLTVSNVDATTVGNYRCVVRGLCNSVATSSDAPLSLANLSITQQPQPQTVSTGGSTPFSVGVTGTSPTYKWQKDGVDLVEGGHYAGVTTATLTVSNVDAADYGSYTCVISNTCGNVTSAAAALTRPTSSILAWNSVRQHGGAERGVQLDKDALVSGTPTIEARSGGIQKVQVRFDRSITLADPAAVTVVSGADSYPPTVSINPMALDTMELVFTPALPDGRCYTVTIGMAAIVEVLTGDADCSIRALAGDATGNGVINLGDVLYIRSQLEQAADSVPWLDMDLNGQIDMADVLAVKALVTGTAAPLTCP